MTSSRGRQRRRRVPTELDLADEQLAEVEPDRPRSPEAVVDEHEPGSAVGPRQQVVRAGVAVTGELRHGRQLGDVVGGPVGGGEQPLAQLGVERAGQQRVVPHVGVLEHRHDLVGQAPVEVVGDRPSVASDVGELGDGRAGGEAAEEVRGEPEALEVPRHRRRHVHLLQPDARRRLVEVEHAVGGRHQQAVRQPGGEVGAVDEGLRPPRHARRGHLADVLGHHLEQRRPRPRLHRP